MTLSIIIVTYNTKDLTLLTLKSVLKEIQSSSTLKNKTEIFVVDNNSKDDTIAAIKKEFPLKFIHIIANKDNKGFAGANNQAIKKSQGEFIILLNSDTLVQKNGLATLVETFKRFPIDDSTSTLASAKEKIDRLGILAPTLINPDGTIQPQGGDLPNLLALMAHMTFLDDLPVIGKFLPSTQHTGLRTTEELRYHTHDRRLIKRGWVAGTAMMFRKQVVDEIGLLDDNIFMYGEDVEFCLRAKKHHWDVAIDPMAKITHIGQASSTSANALRGEFNSYSYIWAKHKPHWQIPLAKSLVKLGVILRAIVFTLIGHKEKGQIYRDLSSEF